MQLDLERFHLTAIVLAGDRTKKDSLIDHSGAACKALIDIDGIPMVHRVLASLGEAKVVDNIVLSGPQADEIEDEAGLQKMIVEKTITWRAPDSSPSTSAFRSMKSLLHDFLTVPGSPLHIACSVEKTHLKILGEHSFG